MRTLQPGQRSHRAGDVCRYAMCLVGPLRQIGTAIIAAPSVVYMRSNSCDDRYLRDAKVIAVVSTGDTDVDARLI